MLVLTEQQPGYDHSTRCVVRALTVLFEGIEAEPARARPGRVVVRDTGVVRLFDETGVERECHGMRAGDVLLCDDGAALAPGAAVFERHSYRHVLVADIPSGVEATVQRINLELPGAQRVEVHDATGLTTHRVNAMPPGSEPALVLRAVDASGAPTETLFRLPVDSSVCVADGARVRRGDTLATVGPYWGRYYEPQRLGLDRLEAYLEARRTPDAAVIAPVDGMVRIAGHSRGSIALESGTAVHSIACPPSRWLTVRDGDWVRRGDALTYGERDHHDLLRALGPDAFAAHLCDEIAMIYRLRGLRIAEHQIELIVRAMLSRVEVRDPGDTDLIHGEICSRDCAEAAARRVMARGGRGATWDSVLTGISALARVGSAVGRSERENVGRGRST